MTEPKKPSYGVSFNWNAGSARSAMPPVNFGLSAVTASPPKPPAAPPVPAPDLPLDAVASNTQGNEWLQANRPADALRAYDRAIALRPDYVDPHFNRGNALLQLNRPEEALASFEKAAVLSPMLTVAQFNRGAVLQSLNRLPEALASFNMVLALDPQHVQARFNVGCLHLAQNRFEETVECMDEVIQQMPKLAQAHLNRGVALLKLRRLQEAVTSFDLALARQPNYAEALSNRGHARMLLKELQTAVADLQQAVKLNPEQAQARHNLGLLLRQYQRHEDALIQFEKAYSIAPDLPGVLSDLVATRCALCDWSSLETELGQIDTLVRQGRRGVGPFPLLAWRDDPALQQKAARIAVSADCPERPSMAPQAQARREGKIRVGYFSADFHQHATTVLMAELFERHDRDRFEWFAFSFGPDVQDAMRARVRGAFDHFLDARGRSDEEIALRARSLGIDIAVDLKGFTTDTRFGIFAYRCAPVQVSYLGYPGTTGAPYMDYVIADKVVLPPEEQVHFDEKAVYLPHSYQVNDASRAIAEQVFEREALGLPDSGFVFCCFNNNHKIQPATFAGWMRILNAVPGSVLWLLEDNPVAARNLRREAEARGVAPERLVFAPRMPLPQHLARHRAADLFLDTLPYNAHTTTSDALWAGLPVLTCAGRSFASRVAASLLHAVGLPELVTTTQADYEARAIALARDPAQLQALRQRLQTQCRQSPLFDATGFARHLEAAYTQMHERRVQGLRPAVIEVPAA